MNIYTTLLILFAHFVADFILQTDKQAINKSTSNLWLSAHVLSYGLGLLIVSIGLGFSVKLIGWILTNMSLHWVTDWVTSRVNSYLWKKEQRHWFFVGIGADQLVHYSCLLLTFPHFQ